ncbi:hypothetical protein [Microbacterium sp. NPDC055357]
MAAHVLRLRLALLVGALRGSTGRTARIAMALILLAAVISAACWALVSMTDAAPEALFAVTVIGGSALTLGFALGPVIGGVDDPLDPRRFALLSLAHGRLAAVLALVGFVSVPVMALIAVAVTSAVVWGEHGSPLTAGISSVVLGVTTCVLMARVFMGLTSLFLRERRTRELTGLFVLLVVVVLVPTGVFLGSLEWDGTVPAALADAVGVLAVTPLGAAWAIPGRAAADDADVWPAVLVALLTLVILAAAWRWIVGRLLTTTERPLSVRERTGLGWFAVAPGTPGGAIAARSLLYWSRDRRYLMNVIVIPVAAVVTVVPLIVAGVPFETAVLVPVLFAALFLGWLPHNDVAYDSTAVWMHIASGVRGWSDRLGRIVPVLLIGLPLLAVAVPITVALHGDPTVLPALAGVTASLFFSALGLSCVASVLAPYAVSRPGESPFQQPQRTGAAGAISQTVVMLGAIACSIPALWWCWQAMNGDETRLTLALWGGLGIGLGVFVLGIAVGSVLFERRGGRVMEFAESTG